MLIFRTVILSTRDGHSPRDLVLELIPPTRLVIPPFPLMSSSTSYRDLFLSRRSPNKIMKFFVFTAIFASALAGAANAATVPPEGLAAGACYWDGTAPFCAGGCPQGYTEKKRNSCGDGACCVTGYKVYCCKN